MNTPLKEVSLQLFQTCRCFCMAIESNLFHTVCYSNNGVLRKRLVIVPDKIKTDEKESLKTVPSIFLFS